MKKRKAPVLLISFLLLLLFGGVILGQVIPRSTSPEEAQKEAMKRDAEAHQLGGGKGKEAPSKEALKDIVNMSTSDTKKIKRLKAAGDDEKLESRISGPMILRPDNTVVNNK